MTQEEVKINRPIRNPLSPGPEWIEISPYRSYADLAHGHLTDGQYFEAIVISAVGFDVLVNSLPDRIRLYHFEKLTPLQKKALRNIEAGDRQTAGTILQKLKNARILHWRLDQALGRFNQERNRVIHPIERQEKIGPQGSPSYVLSVKQNGIVPGRATRRDAEKYFRLFCHIIDLSGGESPRKSNKMRAVYPSMSEQLAKIKEERRLEKSPTS
jgi:hypothetical protein